MPEIRYNIIPTAAGNRLYWSSDQQQEIDTAQNKQHKHCSQKINRSKARPKLEQS